MILFLLQPDPNLAPAQPRQKLSGRSCLQGKIVPPFDGTTVSLTRVSAGQIRPRAPHEIHHARPFDRAGS